MWGPGGPAAENCFVKPQITHKTGNTRASYYSSGKTEYKICSGPLATSTTMMVTTKCMTMIRERMTDINYLRPNTTQKRIEPKLPLPAWATQPKLITHRAYYCTLLTVYITFKLFVISCYAKLLQYTSISVIQINTCY